MIICTKCCRPMIKEDLIWLCDPPEIIEITIYKCSMCKYEIKIERQLE